MEQATEQVPGMQEETYEFANEVVQTFSAMNALVTIFNTGGEAFAKVLLDVSRVCSIIIMLAYVAYIFFQLVTHRKAMEEADGDGEGDEEEPRISIIASIGVMVVATVVVSFSSDLL